MKIENIQPRINCTPTMKFSGILLFLFTLKGFSQPNPIEFFITDSSVALTTTMIPKKATLAFFIETLGKPDRTKKQKDILKNIYDDIGLSINSNSSTEEVISISFSYTTILKEYPKTTFKGKIYVNGVLLNSDESPEAIEAKLQGFKFENILGLCLFDNNKTDFYITIIPRRTGQWTHFGYNFFRRKKE